MGQPDRSTQRVAEDHGTEPHLFLALDGNYPTLPTSRHRLGEVSEILIGRGKERSIEREPAAHGQRLVLRFPDPWMSSSHAWIRREAGSSWVLSDANSKNGSFVNGAVRSGGTLVDGDVVQCGHTFFVFRERAPIAADQPADYIADLTVPPALSSLLVPLGRALSALLSGMPDGPLLLAGEIGTGKQHLARAVHEALAGSLGRTGDLVEVASNEISADALFRSGRDGGLGEQFVRARGGTLYLAEVSGMSMHAQYALVRALDFDADSPSEDRVLVIAASHRDLAHLVKRRAFRPDLAQTLGARTTVLPPLRQRREDVGLLIAGGLRNAGDDARALSFSSEASRAMLAYAWPHNVAELAGCLHNAAEQTSSAVVDIEHLPPELQRASFDSDSSGDTLDTIDLSDRARRQRELAAILHAAGRVMILDKTRED